MNTDDLLSCPHCGSLDVDVFENTDQQGRLWARCASCDSCSPFEVWNQRDDAEELIDTMVKLLPFAIEQLSRPTNLGLAFDHSPQDRKRAVKEASLWAVEVCRAAHKRGKDLS